MKEVMKGMLVVLVILYIVSPFDLCPGPIDDILVLLLGVAAKVGTRVLERRNEE